MSATRSMTFRLAARAFAALLVLAAFGVGVAFALGYFDAGRKITAVQQELTAKMAAVAEKANNRQRLSNMKDMGEKVRSLPDQLRRPLAGQGQKLIVQHIKTVMAMPPAERAAAMDKDIELMQMISQEIQQQRAEQAAQQGDKSGGSRGGSGDPNQSNAGRNRMLSSIPADQRANSNNNRQLFQAYQAMLQNRATERGISLPTFGHR